MVQPNQSRRPHHGHGAMGHEAAQAYTPACGSNHWEGPYNEKTLGPTYISFAVSNVRIRSSRALRKSSKLISKSTFSKGRKEDSPYSYKQEAEQLHDKITTAMSQLVAAPSSAGVEELQELHTTPRV